MNEVIKEIIMEVKWYEKIGIAIFKKLIYDAYKRGMSDCFNWLKK